MEKPSWVSSVRSRRQAEEESFGVVIEFLFVIRKRKMLPSHALGKSQNSAGAVTEVQRSSMDSFATPVKILYKIVHCTGGAKFAISIANGTNNFMTSVNNPRRSRQRPAVSAFGMHIIIITVRAYLRSGHG